MSKTGERLIDVSNGEACPRCLRVYPAEIIGPITTCPACGFVNRLAEIQKIRDDVNADTTPFQALGKPRMLNSRYHEAKRRASEGD